jgi:CubicO group peptidase (beta-lactamase class C family)
MTRLISLFVLLSMGQRLGAADFKPIDDAVEAAIARGDCPGAVVVVLHKDQVAFRKAYGSRSVEPEKAPMAVDAVFDLASLTKPIATGTSVMLLIEQGKLKPEDKVARYWPEFGANGKEEVTAAQLLLHTSGLIADNDVRDYQDGRAKALERIAALKLEAPPGSRFKYSDVGYIVLGELVERISQSKLDEFARKHVFEPLKLADTGFKPNEALRNRVVPTGKRNGAIILGDVHDPRAHLIGGVAGHAGLFSTADDLTRYCRMLLNGGELDGVRILKPETVKLFTEPHEVPGEKTKQKQLRSFGWDIDTAYSVQRGDVFPKGEGYGHTGFTGTSIWVDPKSRTAVILLTSRVHPADKGDVRRLRREVATAAANALK